MSTEAKQEKLFEVSTKKVDQVITGKNGKVYEMKWFTVQTDRHKKPFNVKAYGYPHARNIVNKMLGRINTATN